MSILRFRENRRDRLAIQFRDGRNLMYYSGLCELAGHTKSTCVRHVYGSVDANDQPRQQHCNADAVILACLHISRMSLFALCQTMTFDRAIYMTAYTFLLEQLCPCSTASDRILYEAHGIDFHKVS
jgi:hypothetical protein